MTRAASNESISPPANRLPKRRRVRVTGLTSSSTTFMKRLTGASFGGNGWVT